MDVTEKELSCNSSAVALDHPDLVLADYRLPDGFGTDLLPNYNGKSLLPYPVVIMTGQGDEYIAVETIKAGACDCVIKSDSTMADMPHIASRVLRDWRLIANRQASEAALFENEKLLELDQLKSLFIASMSRELRTSLNSIIGFTGMILQGTGCGYMAVSLEKAGRRPSSGRAWSTQCRRQWQRLLDGHFEKISS